MATKQDNSFAVIEIAGHQHLVKVGDTIETNQIDAKEGDKIVVKEVLLVNNGDTTKVGTPYVESATVELTHDKQIKGEKVDIRKFRAKSRYRRTTGHRQPLSRSTVTAIKA